MLDSDIRWRCRSNALESSTAWRIPCDTTIKLAELLLVVISNTFFSKTLKLIVFCHNNVLLFLCFFLLLFSSSSFNRNSQRRRSQINFNVILSPLCIPNTSWKFISLLMKHPGVMSFKCRRSVGSVVCQKMRTPKLYFILKKIITKGMTYMQTTTKQISLFNAYECLKYPPSVHSLNFTS